ncbi:MULTISPECIES: hypothetical protein [unclassified Kitasatospora]|uniref:hypothetical protein n=1 Tax=unclassified Kitasatospora TaxID=2633591 RepID=UPI0033D4C581
MLGATACDKQITLRICSMKIRTALRPVRSHREALVDGGDRAGTAILHNRTRPGSRHR